MRDDIGKLGLTGPEKSYARGKGMGFLKSKQKRWFGIIRHELNPNLGSRKNFPNRDAGETTSGKRHFSKQYKSEELAQSLVQFLLG